LAAVQVPPFTFLAAQAVLAQKSALTQSVSAAQVVLQAVPPQMNGVQVVVTAAGQAPAPLQVAAAMAVPLAQLAARQLTVAGATAQVPLAVQAPVLPQGGPATQRASVVPATTLAQVPLAPPVLVAEQPWQVPVHVVLQQNPSTQDPVVHCAPSVQAAPVAASSSAPAATHPQMAATAAGFSAC
jgi:hypothetical protein